MRMKDEKILRSSRRLQDLSYTTFLSIEVSSAVSLCAMSWGSSESQSIAHAGFRKE